MTSDNDPDFSVQVRNAVMAVKIAAQSVLRQGRDRAILPSLVEDKISDSISLLTEVNEEVVRRFSSEVIAAIMIEWFSAEVISSDIGNRHGANGKLGEVAVGLSLSRIAANEGIRSDADNSPPDKPEADEAAVGAGAGGQSGA